MRQSAGILQYDVFGIYTEMLILIINARPNNYIRNALYTILSVFNQLSICRATADNFFTTDCLLDTLFTSMILKPRKIFPDTTFVELSEILTNLAGVDNVSQLDMLLEKGIGLAIMTLIADWNGRSMSIIYNCFSALENLFSVYQDDRLY